MKQYCSYEDHQLTELLGKEDEEAFDEIYKRYWKRLYFTASKRLNNNEVCEEIIQDIFTSLWENRTDSRIQNLSGYLFMATKYRVINQIKKEMVYKEALIARLNEDANNQTEERVMLNDLKTALNKEINRLPSACRKVYKLSFENNLTVKQVAEELAISEKTVENQLVKARKAIRLRLKEYSYLL